MKNKILLSFVILGFLLMFPNLVLAVPLGLGFDPAGDGETNGYSTIYGFRYSTDGSDSETRSVISGGDQTANFWTNQSASHAGDSNPNILGNDDTFTENLQFSVSRSVDENNDNDLQLGTYNINFSIELDGYITNYTNPNTVDYNDSNTISNIETASFTSVFTGGSANIWIDTNNDGVQDSGEDDISTFSLEQAPALTLDDTVFGGGSLGSNITFSFLWETASIPEYWDNVIHDPSMSQTFNDLLSLDLAFASSDDSITNADALSFNGTNIGIPFTASGGVANFEAVPEPTTLLLFGTGLLGLAAFGRKKFIKKS